MKGSVESNPCWDIVLHKNLLNDPEPVDPVDPVMTLENVMIHHRNILKDQ